MACSTITTQTQLLNSESILIELMNFGPSEFTELSDVRDVPETDSLTRNGYIRNSVKKYTDTIQGQLFTAHNLNDNNKPVFIKKIPLMNCDHRIIDNKSVKQSLILREIQIHKTAIKDNMAHYIDFFHSQTHAYFVMELNFSASLHEFVLQSHKYIQYGKLSFKQYRKTIRYLLWKLLNTIAFLHNQLNYSNLDLCPENIFLSNADFIKNGDGSVTINSEIDIKFIDFPINKLFNTHHSNAYLPESANGFFGDMKDGKSCDMFAFGMVFYFCCFGTQFMEPDGVSLIFGGKLRCYLGMHNLLRLVCKRSVVLMNGLLTNQFTVDQTLQHKFFKSHRSHSSNHYNY